MPSILVTGASGFLGGRVIQAAAEAGHDVIALARRRLDAKHDRIRSVRGDFASFEDLRRLDDLTVDAVVHLAAETGGCAEEAGIATNVAGTRRLVRYLLDRGVRRYTLASSIAATGCLDASFVPQRLPIPDDHPYLGRDMYGLSKAMMEQLIGYFANGCPDASLISFRIGAVVSPGWNDGKPLRKAGTFSWGPFADMSRVMDADVVAAILRSLEVAPRAGHHVYNVVGPDVAAADPVPEVVRQLRGPAAAADVSWYQRPGHEFDPIYDLRKLRDEFGYAPTHSVRE